MTVVAMVMPMLMAMMMMVVMVMLMTMMMVVTMMVMVLMMMMMTPERRANQDQAHRAESRGGADSAQGKEKVRRSCQS